MTSESCRPRRSLLTFVPIGHELDQELILIDSKCNSNRVGQSHSRRYRFYDQCLLFNSNSGVMTNRQNLVPTQQTTMSAPSPLRTYTDLPYEIRNAILLAAVDPELIPLFNARGERTRARPPDSKHRERLNLTLKTFEALSQIPSFYQHDGLASVAKTHIHRLAENFAHWRVLRRRHFQLTEPDLLDEHVENPRAFHGIYYFRCTTFACNLVRMLKLNASAAFDLMVAEVMHWDVGSLEAANYDPEGFFEDLTRVYERAVERGEQPLSNKDEEFT